MPMHTFAHFCYFGWLVQLCRYCLLWTFVRLLMYCSSDILQTLCSLICALSSCLLYWILCLVNLKLFLNRTAQIFFIIIKILFVIFLFLSLLWNHDCVLSPVVVCLVFMFFLVPTAYIYWDLAAKETLSILFHSSASSLCFLGWDTDDRDTVYIKRRKTVLVYWHRALTKVLSFLFPYVIGMQL